ncbi:hypothetical protein ACFFX0_15380 [Citricoccus parietis]|uniref:Uncharacterized protein n=1 Tax=Citricoccus parietis TaxID=592307 RepID=A0ABV5G0P5_9MICC
MISRSSRRVPLSSAAALFTVSLMASSPVHLVFPAGRCRPVVVLPALGLDQDRSDLIRPDRARGWPRRSRPLRRRPAGPRGPGRVPRW